jgi:hypothetical protein
MYSSFFLFNSRLLLRAEDRTQMADLTLDDLLKSSSEEDSPKKGTSQAAKDQKKVLRRRTSSLSPGSSPSPSVGQSPKAAARIQRMQEVAERKKRLEEIDKRMAETLGTSVVETVTAKVNEAQQKQLQASTSSPAYSDDWETSNPVSGRNPNLGLPPTAPPFGGDTPPKRLDPSALKDGTFNAAHYGPRGSFHNPRDSEDYGIMVCDRGCQTTTTVEVQTDPEPHVVHCERCYSAYYGHPPTRCELCGETDFPTRSIGTGIGGSYGHGYGGANNAHRGYSRSGPPPTQVRSVAALKAQLSFVQSTVDSIIAKYNLPPPPKVY